MPIALITFVGHKLKAFFLKVFLPCQIIKGSPKKLSDHPTPCVADHRTARAVTFALFNRCTWNFFAGAHILILTLHKISEKLKMVNDYWRTDGQGKKFSGIAIEFLLLRVLHERTLPRSSTNGGIKNLATIGEGKIRTKTINLLIGTRRGTLTYPFSHEE